MVKGPTLHEALDNVQEPVRLLRSLCVFRYRASTRLVLGTVPVGRVETGIMKPGMMILFARCGVKSECKSVGMHHEALSEARPGDDVMFNVLNATVNDILRWHVASDAKNKPAMAARTSRRRSSSRTKADPEGLHGGP